MAPSERSSSAPEPVHSRKEPAEILAMVRRHRESRRFRKGGASRRKMATHASVHQGLSKDMAAARPVCFLCGETLFGNDDDVNRHIDRCLSRQANGIAAKGKKEEEEEHQGAMTQDVGDNDNGSGETYTWAGQTRVRAVTLLEGDIAATLGLSTRRASAKDMEDELDIENDATVRFGPSQYHEQHIVWDSLPVGTGAEAEVDLYNDPSATAAHHLVMEAMKSKLRQQEQMIRHTPKCLICLEPYKTPVVSIVCWHVYCEQCWLLTLGAKKLCPQCNVIASACDLRKLYL
jgi:hypothetical protein